MKIIVLGATGYLGSHIAEQLMIAGHDITCLVRANTDCSFLQSIQAPLQVVDFNNRAEIAKAIPAQATVINCIADTRPHASFAQRKIIEIDLTTALFQLAQAANARRFIQLSTVMAYGFERPAHAIDEEQALQPSYIYNQIAAAREHSLLQQADKAATELILLRPSNAIGKRDSAFLPSFISSHRWRLFPVVSGGQWNFSCIDARDIGRAMVHLLSVKVEQPEIFLVKGFDLNWLSFKDALDDYLGKPSYMMNMPKSLMMPLAALMERIFPFGSKPPMTRFDLAVLSTHTLFDDSKIRATGFTPQYNLRDSFIDALTKAQ